MLNDKSLRIIDRNTTLSLIDFPGLINTAEIAFVAQAEGKAPSPEYINLPIGDNFAHYKAGYIQESNFFALKYSGGFWSNSHLGLPVDYGFVIVHDAKTGRPVVMFMDKGAITDYRTAAAGAVASKYASRMNSKIVGLIGTGIQARLQIEALLHVRPNVKTIRVWGRHRDKVKVYITDMEKKTPKLTFIACFTPEQAVRDVDILITVTPSRSPIVKTEWVSHGTHITAVGACAPYMQEHEPEVLKKADKIYADSIEKCSHDGELHHGFETGIIDRSKITGEIGQLIKGQVEGRVSDKEITFVDLVGLGIQDATAAEYLLSKLQ